MQETDPITLRSLLWCWRHTLIGCLCFASVLNLAIYVQAGNLWRCSVHEIALAQEECLSRCCRQESALLWRVPCWAGPSVEHQAVCVWCQKYITWICGNVYFLDRALWCGTVIAWAEINKTKGEGLCFVSFSAHYCLWWNYFQTKTVSVSLW